MSTTNGGTRRTAVVGLLPFLLAGACAAPGGPAGSGSGPIDDSDVVGVSLSLTVAQSDAKCLRLTFTGPTTFSQTAAPAVPVILTGLPVGAFALQVEAYNLVCGSVVATTPVTWTSDTVPVVLTTGSLTPVTVTLKRPAASLVTVDYDTSQLFQALPSGVSLLGDMVVLGNTLYVARSEIERVSLAGGNIEGTLQATANHMVVDASGIFYATSTSPVGTFWVPPGQPQVAMSSTVPPFMAAIPGGYVYSEVGNAANPNTGTIFRNIPATGLSVLVSGFSNNALPLLATDGTTVYYAVVPPGTSQTIIGKIPVAGGNSTTLATLPSGASVVDLTTDGTFVYAAQRSTTPALNGIGRLPVAGGAPAQIAPVPLGVPTKLIVDATNVFYTTHILDNRGLCDSSSISRVAKAGGTATPLWTRSKTCPRQLTQSALQLYFDVGVNVHRLDK